MSGFTVSFARLHRKVGSLLGLGLGLLMTGCASTTWIETASPEDSLKAAISTAKHGQVEHVQDVMTGPALESFGSKEGLATLHKKLSKIISIDPPQLVSSEQGDQGNGHTGDIWRFFRANVSGRTKEGAAARYTAHITCDVAYAKEHSPFDKGTCLPDPSDPSGPDLCQPDTPASDWEGERQHCRVSELVAAPTP
jgi:hypothetical protein